MFVLILYILECQLPASWNGSWYLSGHQNPVLINETYISHAGNCLEQSGQKFLFHHRYDLLIENFRRKINYVM